LAADRRPAQEENAGSNVGLRPRVGRPLIASGIAFGLLSSAALGVSDLTAGLLARRIGSLRVAAGELFVSMLLLLVLLRLSGLTLPSDPGWILWIGLVGTLRAFGYFALVRAFSLGPVAVVSPIIASNSAVTVLAGVILLGERPSPAQYIAVIIGSIGSLIVALSLNRSKGKGTGSIIAPGPAFAIVAMVCLSIVVAAQQPPIRQVGWLQTIALRRIVEVCVTWATLGLAYLVVPARLGLRPWHSLPPSGAAGSSPSSRMTAMRRVIGSRSLRFLVAIGFVDTIGLSALALALSVGPAWLFGLVGTTGPLVAITYGLVVLRERLLPQQWLGIGLVAAAVLLAAVG
jgi:drug/metabolite transporter (DMT)-like permease